MTAARRVPVAGRRAATACGRAAAAGWRAAAPAADRIWYGRPGVLMTAYVVLIAAGREVAHSAGRSSRQAGLEVAVLLLLIWCWRVTRGGDLSRILLLLTTWWAIGFSVDHLAIRWDIQDAVVLAISAAQLALLLSPAVYLATREDMAVQFRATGRWLVPVAGGGRADPQAEPARSALTLRLRPRWWLLLAALGSGLVITLTCVITVHYEFLPHCLPPSHPSAGGWRPVAPASAAVTRCPSGARLPARTRPCGRPWPGTGSSGWR